MPVSDLDTPWIKHKQPKGSHLTYNMIPTIKFNVDIIMSSCMQSQQVFVDADAPTIRKKIKKLSKQEPYESRVVWRNLTEAMARDDSEAAGEAKHTVRPSVVTDFTKDHEYFL